MLLYTAFIKFKSFTIISQKLKNSSCKQKHLKCYMLEM